MAANLMESIKNRCDVVSATSIAIECSDVLEIDTVHHAAIEAVWEAALERNPQLFNAEILMMRRWEKDSAGNLRIFTAWGNYKMLLASRSVSALQDVVRPVGVSGVMICHVDDVESETTLVSKTALVFARRSSTVASYPGYWELMPSGSISRHTAQKDASTHIDILAQILEEFEEETGFSTDIITEISPFTLIFDKQANIYDICVRLHISWTQNTVIKRFQGNNEYTEVACITLPQLPNFLRHHAETLVPTSIALAETFLPTSP